MYGSDYVWILQGNPKDLWWQNQTQCIQKQLAAAVEGLIVVSTHSAIVGNKPSISGLVSDIGVHWYQLLFNVYLVSLKVIFLFKFYAPGVHFYLDIIVIYESKGFTAKLSIEYFAYFLVNIKSVKFEFRNSSPLLRFVVNHVVSEITMVARLK